MVLSEGGRHSCGYSSILPCSTCCLLSFPAVPTPPPQPWSSWQASFLLPILPKVRAHSSMDCHFGRQVAELVPGRYNRTVLETLNSTSDGGMNLKIRVQAPWLAQGASRPFGIHSGNPLRGPDHLCKGHATVHPRER